MNIVVIGAGYVGLVTSACFAELGNLVTCIDISDDKITNLKQGILPIYEPGLQSMVQSNLTQHRLFFENTLQKITYLPHVIFIAVGTPGEIDGSADLQYVLKASHDIGQFIQQYSVIVDKSTVPVGITDEVQKIIQSCLDQRQIQIPFDIVSNPEFLREGAAIEDFMRPDRIIIGLTSEKAKSVMQELYTPILRHPEKIFFMNVKDAEMTKYASNAMLATKISFMNEIAILCERMGVDVENVRIGIGADSRIGSSNIYPGCGYGGSCFPKDVRALIRMAEQHEVNPYVLKAIEKRNTEQKQILSKKITSIFGSDLSHITVGIWGLSFKPETDDMRDASSLVLLEHLIQHKARIQAYDPAALPVAKRLLPKEWFAQGQLQLVEHQYDALSNADIMVLVTEWKPFCYPDLHMMKKLMRRHIILDGRNQYDPKKIKEAQFEYYGIGRS